MFIVVVSTLSTGDITSLVTTQVGKCEKSKFASKVIIDSQPCHKL